MCGIIALSMIGLCLAFLIFGDQFFYSFLKYFISYHAQKYIQITYKNLHLDITKNFFAITTNEINKKRVGYYIQRMTNDTIDPISLSIL